MRLLTTFLLFFSVASCFAAEVFQIENPKYPITKVGVRYNRFYDVLELENKFVQRMFKISKGKKNLEFFVGVNLHTQAPKDLKGHYAVIDMFGIIGFVSKFDLTPRVKLWFYPLYHESSHYTDGLLRAPARDPDWKNKMSDEEIAGVSQESAILDLFWQANPNLDIFFGGGYYYHTTSRVLNSFVHLGNNYFVGRAKRLFFATDFGFTDEEIGASFSTNVSVGYDIKIVKLLVGFERQRGLGKDFRNIQNKVGVEVIYAP